MIPCFRNWRSIFNNRIGILARIWLSLLLAIPIAKKWNWLTVKLARVVLRARLVTKDLATLPSTRILSLMHNEITQVIVFGTQPDQVPLQDLLMAVDSRDLRGSAADAISRHQDAIARSEFLYQVVCLSGLEVTRDQRATALMAIARISETLLSTQARQILVQCLRVAGQPVDPYEPPDLSLLARRAATAVLEEHPSLDEVVYDRLVRGAWSSDVEVLAAALVRRPNNRPESIAAFFDCWKPSTDNARRFAAAVDVTRTSKDRPPVLEVEDTQRRTAARRVAATGIKRYGVPVMVILVIGISWRYHWPQAPLRPTFSEALAALAVVAAIHVVSAQLAATRLDGVLARYSTSSIPLAISYWAAIFMALCGITQRSHPRIDHALSWGSTISAVIFVSSAVTAAWSLVRQTDPARAAALFADNRASFYRRSGSRQGRFQVSANEFRNAAAQLSFVALTSEPVHVERRAPILAGSRGVHIPSIRRLRTFKSRRMWSDGKLRLQLLGTIGTVISAGTEIGAVLPDANSSVPITEHRRAAKALRLKSAKRIENAAEGAVVLAAVASRLARVGDQGGGERTGEALVDLLRIHIDAAQRVRAENLVTDVPPVTPALKSAIHALTTYLLESKSFTEQEVLTGILIDVIQLGEPSDAAVIIAIGRIAALEASLPSVRTADLLRVMARTCLVTGDHVALRQVEGETHKRFRRSGRDISVFVEAAADIVAMAAWLDQPVALAAWKRFWKAAQQLGDLQLRIYSACRIGAANLAAGSITVAVEVVFCLRSAKVDIAKLAEALKDREYASREILMADLGGGYLGQTPGDAIVQFGEFARSTAQSVSQLSSSFP